MMNNPLNNDVIHVGITKHMRTKLDVGTFITINWSVPLLVLSAQYSVFRYWR